MFFQTRTPAPPLSESIEQFVLSQDYRPGHRVEHVLPSGTMQLIVDLRDDCSAPMKGDQLQECGGVAVSGMQSSPIVLDTASMESVICVPFKAGGVFRLLGCAADELKDACLPLHSLWGNAANDLREQLLEAAPAERLGVLEKTLMQRIVSDNALHAAVEIAIRVFDASPWRTVASVVKEVGLSERRFIQLFKQHVGATPKQFCRIQRFQRALWRIECEVSTNWVNLALDCGYFDQSHFVNEFGSLAGMSPTQYLSRGRPHRNHVVAADEATGRDSSR